MCCLSFGPRFASASDQLQHWTCNIFGIDLFTKCTPEPCPCVATLHMLCAFWSNIRFGLGSAPALTCNRCGIRFGIHVHVLRDVHAVLVFWSNNFFGLGRTSALTCNTFGSAFVSKRSHRKSVHVLQHLHVLFVFWSEICFGIGLASASTCNRFGRRFVSDMCTSEISNMSASNMFDCCSHSVAIIFYEIIITLL